MLQFVNMPTETNSSGSVYRAKRLGPYKLFIFAAATIGSQTLLAATTSSRAIDGLRCDALVQPLGMDDPTPSLSWKLNDPLRGARQTAYRIRVYSRYPRSIDKPDVWDSDRIESAASQGLTYAGPPLKPSTRYFWTVEVWGKNRKLYPASAVSWWETGLMKQSAWSAKWIGYESAELHSLRASGAAWITAADGTHPTSTEAHYDYRLHFLLDKPVRRVVLYTTGKDTVSAWINDTQLMFSKPRVPWNDMPWMTYEKKEVTTNAKTGNNTLAIQITSYNAAQSTNNRSPMSACVYVVYTDGTTQVLISDTSHWKAEREAQDEWWKSSYDDSGWKQPQPAYDAATPTQFGPGRPWPTGPVVILRHSFEVRKQLVSARLYATALGAYSFELNGSKVGDQILAPGYMDFREHVPYQAYDVTPMIKNGPNAVGAYLAAGWYATPLTWYHEANNYGATQPALRAELRLQFADGTVSWITTDETWKAQLSEITQAEIYDGETVDATQKINGWSLAEFQDASWFAAQLVTPKEPQIVWQYFPPIRAERALGFQAVTTPKPGSYILDFGQNMSAIPHLRIAGHRGDVVQMRFGELLNSDGTLYTENLRSAKATDTYILAGTGTEDFEPHFTYHGFRYVEITGLHARPTTDTLRAVVIHTDAPFTMHFFSGSPLVNKLWSNVMWGQRSNFIGLPSDCPQRDERLGWTADAQVFWRTASFNMDLDTFTKKFASDLRGTQADTPMFGIIAPGIDKPNFGYAAGWSDAGVIIPWTGWIQSGDRKIIDENWNGMVRYLDHIEQENPEHLWRTDFGAAFGDWLTPTATTPEDLIATAYWAHDVALMQQMAAATNRPEDADRFAHLHETIKTAFQQAFVQADGRVGSIGHYPSIPPPTIHSDKLTKDKNRFVETQTGYALALHMDLLTQEQRVSAATHLMKLLEQNHGLLGTGFLGTPYLLEVLSDTGHSDVAYNLLFEKRYPSWGYQIEHGATTTWERWNGDKMISDPSMNSYNHYAYGAVAEWLYRYAAGIDTVASQAGFAAISLHPNFNSKMKFLKAVYNSPYGIISSSWQVHGASIQWEIIIPPNTHAVLHSNETNADSYRIDGATRANSESEIPLEPGRHSITAHLKMASD